MPRLEGLDAFRQPQEFSQYLLVCEADYRGRKDFADRPYPQADQFKRLFTAAFEVDTAELKKLPQGREIGQALRRLRLCAIEQERRRLGI